MSAGGVNVKPNNSNDSSNPIKKKVESLVSQKLHIDQHYWSFRSMGEHVEKCYPCYSLDLCHSQNL
ncbi:hypothetical protein X798_04893 [Onchocerca flexuosa]|uniref:Uncharacterized protein n=1 Tax=Onchocerca flexuosa TaxID=387005 RepID=A0A238BS71_9BILA|nr:hypothetical protein X798_04893 [Onchocerca flexuosa]